MRTATGDGDGEGGGEQQREVLHTHRLMCCASTSCTPVASDLPTRSEPARSTSTSFDTVRRPRPPRDPGLDSSLWSRFNVKTRWLREECALTFVTPTARVASPSSSRAQTSSLLVTDALCISTVNLRPKRVEQSRAEHRPFHESQSSARAHTHQDVY